MEPVRRLKLGEGNLYKQIRLESLKDSPEAFASKYEDALSRDLNSWSNQADSTAQGKDRATYIIESSKPLGIAAIYGDEAPSSEGELIQVWVAPELRGRGVIISLLDGLFLWASRSGLTSIRTEVYKSNTRAIRCYENYGFTASATYETETTVTLFKSVAQTQ